MIQALASYQYPPTSLAMSDAVLGPNSVIQTSIGTAFDKAGYQLNVGIEDSRPNMGLRGCGTDRMDVRDRREITCFVLLLELYSNAVFVVRDTKRVLCEPLRLVCWSRLNFNDVN